MRTAGRHLAIVCCACVLGIAACGQEGGTNPGTQDNTQPPSNENKIYRGSTIAVEYLEVVDGCDNGGILIKVGVDKNGNGMLDETTGDDNEVAETQIVCHGQDGVDGAQGDDGYHVLIKIGSAGSRCSNGGHEIRAGIDVNGNGILDENEIIETEYVCHGVDGTDGVDGKDGTDGTDGKDGYNTLIRSSEIYIDDADADQERCPYGGVKFEVGLDDGLDRDGVAVKDPDTGEFIPKAAGNGQLDPGEVDDTTYLCNSQPDGLAPTVDHESPLVAEVVDTDDPPDGGNDAIRLAWDEATDNAYSQGSLTYTVYYSVDPDNITQETATQIKNRLTSNPATAFVVSNIDCQGKAGITSCDEDIANLQANTKYYFNVIVKDDAGNEVAYTGVSVTTP